MKAAKTIERQDWMRSEAAQKLMAVLNAGTPEDEPLALFVGGCVRNTLLGAEVRDLDIATKLRPAVVQELCEETGIRVVPTGLDHGTVTAVIDGQGFEVTTLRKDVETDGRRAVVAFSENWEEDAMRRDFTMNTLLCDGEGRVYDPLGRGLTDLEAGQVVFVGEPAQRIAEDVLRILRFFRFHAYYGHGEADAQALQACRDAAHLIPQLSRERITQEFEKILLGPEPHKTLDLMFSCNVLAEFSNVDLQVFERFCDLQAQTGHVDLNARLYFFRAFGEFDQLLCLSKAQGRFFQALDQALQKADFGSDHAVKVMMYYYGRNVALQVYLYWLAQNDAEAEQSILATLDKWPIPTLPVTGHNMVEAGVPHGPAVGDKLRAIETAWIADGFAQKSAAELLSEYEDLL